MCFTVCVARASAFASVSQASVSQLESGLGFRPEECNLPYDLGGKFGAGVG